MLADAKVTANVPAADIARARQWYEDKLGLVPVTEIGEGMVLVYKTAGSSVFTIYATSYAGQAGHTIMQFHVDDVPKQVETLKSAGVAFERYDLPGVTWDGDVAVLEGMGSAAWFRDSEGNVLCVDSGFPDV